MTETKKASIKELRPDDKNINQSSARGGEMLRRSLQEYGAARSLVADKNMRIVAGNQTLEAAAAIGLDDVVVVPTDGSKLVVVQRTDIDLDTPRGRELAIADNRTNQVGYNPDPLMLAWHGSNGADLDKFWLPDELAALDLPDVDGLDLGDDDDEPVGDADAVPEVEDVPTSRRGDLWILGDHRVLCGDSTDADDVARLMNGERADMVYTDPPYGIGESGDRRGRHGDGSNALGRHVKYEDFNDSTIDHATESFNVCEGLNIKRQVWWGANYYCHHLPQTGNWFVWDKRVEDKQKDLNSDCELAWVKSEYNSVRIFRHLWKGLIKGSENGVARVHPTQKPIALAVWCFEYFEGVKSVLDLFLGSGSTLIAAEETGRKCYGMEISPQYVDVIVKRWQDYTGKEAKHEDGRTFAEVSQTRLANTEES